MKRIIWFVIILVLCCTTSAYVGYLRGKRVGELDARSARTSDALIAMTSLESLRAGNLPFGIHMVESECFADTLVVLSEGGFNAEALRSTMVPSLIKYRETYRTNQADWSPAEQRLESLLRHNP